MSTTETPGTLHTELDTYSSPQLCKVMVEDQFDALKAVQAAVPHIALAIEAALPRVQAGGRLIYVGAGTSGRLGVLDSVELYPTFSWLPERALGILAGGAHAMFVAVEGAEDQREQGALDLLAKHPNHNDIVLLLAASGTTPYVLGACVAAHNAGALTLGFANNPDTPLLAQAEHAILLDTGCELISGSTRLKAGTAQKIALNTFSSGLMIRMNKVYRNLMVDLKPSNAKLRARTIRLTMYATGFDALVCEDMLIACDYQVKTAIVALLCKLTPVAARLRLAHSAGSVRLALIQN